MDIVRLRGMNRDLAPPGGWDAEKHGECVPLPVFAEVVKGDMVMTSAWKPTPLELGELNSGGAVALVVYGTMHPPAALGVFKAADCDVVGTTVASLCNRIVRAKDSEEERQCCRDLANYLNTDLDRTVRGEPDMKPLVTAEDINNSPQNVRDYVHWLSADADPAGTLQENMRLTRENRALRLAMAQQPEVETAVMCKGCDGPILPDPFTGTTCACAPTRDTLYCVAGEEISAYSAAEMVKDAQACGLGGDLVSVEEWTKTREYDFKVPQVEKADEDPANQPG